MYDVVVEEVKAKESRLIGGKFLILEVSVTVRDVESNIIMTRTIDTVVDLGDQIKPIIEDIKERKRWLKSEEGD